MKMNNHHKGTSIDKDICAQQQKVIISQRKQIADLEQANFALKKIEQRYNDLMAGFGSNGNLTYYQVMQSIQTRENAVAEAERQRINLEHKQQWEAEQAAIRQAQEEEVRKEYPDLIKYHENQKAKIQQKRDKILGLAIRFYDMNEDDARLYFADEHKPEESAVQDLINEYLDDQGKFTIYECNYCEAEFKHGLGEFEKHCYNEGQDHRDVTLRRIENNAIAAMGKVSAELQTAIDSTIQSKQNAEYKQRKEQQQADQARAKKDLPLVK